ncbi:esterase [Gammaproteobacteria bacterium]|nr:esterase [Gammaproteobacteria bacterium]
MAKIIYLHGFASSANSTKALQLKKYILENYSKTEIIIPDIENNIVDAVQQIDKLIEEFSPSALIGSSLGGFYATYFSEQYNLKCVGINPAVIPPAEMSKYLGENKNYSTGEKFLINQEQLDLLDRMGREIKVIKCPRNFMILLQSHDEKLDYRVATNFYRGAVLDVTFGGNHSFENLETHFSKIKIFLNMH